MSLPPQEQNTLGKTSLTLGILSLSFVFGLGLCALAGGIRVPVVANFLFICGASSAFLGLIGAMVGVGGLFNRAQSRATALVGLALGLGGLCLFLTILRSL